MFCFYFSNIYFSEKRKCATGLNDCFSHFSFFFVSELLVDTCMKCYFLRDENSNNLFTLNKQISNQHKYSVVHQVYFVALTSILQLSTMSFGCFLS